MSSNINYKNNSSMKFAEGNYNTHRGNISYVSGVGNNERTNKANPNSQMGSQRNFNSFFPQKGKGDIQPVSNKNVSKNKDMNYSKEVYNTMGEGISEGPKNGVMNYMNSNNNNNVNKSNSGYSLGLYIDNPDNAFVLDEEDLRKLFSFYKGAQTIRIVEDRAAAQVYFYDSSMIQQVKKDIDGLTIPEVGTVRCIVLNKGKTIEQFLPFSSNDPMHLKKNQSHPNEETMILLKKLTHLLQQMQNTTNHLHNNGLGKGNVMENPNHKIGDSLNPEEGSLKMYHTTENYNAPSGKNEVGSTHRVPSKKMSRIELVDIFGFPNEFDVMKKILGNNNSNMNYINEQTNHVIEISIKGKPSNKAPVVERMHIAVASDEMVLYKRAIHLILKVLCSVFREFCTFCEEKGVAIPVSLGFKRHEYLCNTDGSTVYLGVKESGYMDNNTFKTDMVFRKKKNGQANDFEPRGNNNHYFGKFGTGNSRGAHMNKITNEGKEGMHKEFNQANFRNMKMTRTREM